MKIKEIIALINDSAENINDKSELKLKKRLLGILIELLEKDLTIKQNNLLEEKLHFLFNEVDFKTIYKKDFKKRLNELMEFLNKKLFLFSEGHYTGIGCLIGTMFGLIFQSFSLTLMKGSIFNLYSGLIFMIVGIAVGSIVDSLTKRQGRSLKTSLYY